MSSVFKRGKRFYLRYKTAAGAWAQEVSAARSREEAKSMAAELELKHARIARGLEVEPGDPTLTFAGLFAWWWETHGRRMSPTTVTSKGPALRRHVLPKLGPLLLREVTSARLEVLFDELGTVLAGSSVNGHRSMLHAIFARAAKRGLWIGTNPVKLTERRKETRREFESLGVDEVPLLLAQLDERWKPLFAAAIFTGMRKGELAGLRRGDVDMVAGVINVRRSWSAETTKGRVEAPVPIAAPLRPFLEHALRGPSDFVFPGPSGEMMSADTKLHHVLRRALARGGLAKAWLHVCRRTKPKRCGFSESRANDVALPCPDCGFRLWPKAVPRAIRFHDLRGTTATLLAQSGAGLAVAQRVLRHSDPALTANIYTRVSVEQMRAALDGIVPSMTPVEEPAAEPARAAVNAGDLAAPVLQPTEQGSGGSAERAATTALLDGNTKSGKRDLNPRPLPWQDADSGGNGGASRARPMNHLPVRVVSTGSTEPSARRASPFTTSLAAPVLQVSSGPVLTVRQVAERLAVSTATVYALCERGELVHYRVSNAIRIESVAVDLYLLERRQGGLG